MNIWHYELTDRKSAIVRLILRLLWLFIGLALAWLFLRHFLQPLRVAGFLLVGSALYLSLVGLAFDLWKLRHPETSRLTFQWMATLAMLPILIGIPVAIFLF